ncbi:tail fiber domain-containing protein [Streptomyces tauricus]|uniref:hypothetical protein n=1 Tax=Streptomyces tauricus TaxID=68274 RepID=UPI0022446B41|nr:hypothetical protein [Streptomyces tauricus]MCW8101655.1 tail fiber domain-containing protein [Streptomyces tauricus]
METWRQFRRALVQLMKQGGVTAGQMVKASEAPPNEGSSGTVPSFRMIRRSTFYGYLKDNDAPVGNGDWHIIDNILQCIAYLAEANGHPVSIDSDSWQRDWQYLVDRNAQPRDITPDSWIGGWDGAADAVLAHSSAQEFTVWPPGQERLDLLSQAVAYLSAAYEPQLAKDASERLAYGALEEFGEYDPRTLAAWHAFVFWTGQTGEVRLALEQTSHLRAKCRSCLGDDHILSRLAALREAWWTGHMGRWHEANRRYIDTARAEADRPDRDSIIWLLARWGMARTGGRAGNWMHAYAELHDLLPSVIEVFGQDHPVALDAGNAYAWAAGRAGRLDETCSQLERFADQADTVLGSGHPTSLRLRTSLAYWTLRGGSTDEAFRTATAVHERCEVLLGPDHPLSVQAGEVEALCLMEFDEEVALTAFSDVLARAERRFGHRHPQTLQAASNLAAVRATVEGPEQVLEVLEDLAEETGRVWGDEHPDTLRVRMNLVIATLEAQGAWAARPLCGRIVDSLRKVLGDEHPETLEGTDLLKTIEERIRNTEGIQGGPGASQGPNPSYFTGFSGGNEPSDRALKCRVTPVGWSSAPTTGNRAPAQPTDAQSPLVLQPDGFTILRAVASMPVSTWSYLGEEDVQHLGPMAQDWHAALGLGPDNRSIHLVDVNGVSVVAVQALYRMVQSLESELADLRARIDARHQD